MTIEQLRDAVARAHAKRRKKVDDPRWGETLCNVLRDVDLSLLVMLQDEGLDPYGYHAGAQVYCDAWARLTAVLEAEAQPMPEEPWLLPEPAR